MSDSNSKKRSKKQAKKPEEKSPDQDEMFVQAEAAVYRDPQLNRYRGNPLIEALPPILPPKEFVQQISHLPDYDESDRDAAIEVRLHAVGATTGFFQPLPIHVRLEQKISRLIRQGYESRNPMDSNYWQQNDARIDMLTHDPHLLVPSVVNQRTSTLAMALIGYSGMGKSTSLYEILNRGYPQIIKHQEYNEKPFTHYQVSWLKVDCPYDGSINQFCHSVLAHFDGLLGINSYRAYGGKRATANQLSEAIARLAQFYSLGVLVIDEIQRLHYVKQNREKMMSFLVQLINTIGVPILFVGTPDAQQLLATKFSLARRAAGQGDCYWNPLANNGQWKVFIKTLWQYQYTNIQTELTDELNDCLHDQSQGVIDIAIKIYMLAQVAAMEKGQMKGKDESITPSLIETVSKEQLVHLQPKLKALREGDTKQLRLYDDTELIGLDQLLDEQINKVLNRQDTVTV